MGERILGFLVVGFVVWFGWSALKARNAFVIRIAGGRARLQIGTVTPAFLAAVGEICHASNIACGWIGGIRHGKLTRLRFSRHFSLGSQQRIRNEWHLTG
jgi:hypothetical protein